MHVFDLRLLLKRIRIRFLGVIVLWIYLSSWLLLFSYEHILVWILCTYLNHMPSLQCKFKYQFNNHMCVYICGCLVLCVWGGCVRASMREHKCVCVNLRTYSCVFLYAFIRNSGINYVKIQSSTLSLPLTHSRNKSRLSCLESITLFQGSW